MIPAVDETSSSFRSPVHPPVVSSCFRFNPEMMNKYAEVGQKIQALQEELGQTEVECATNEGKIVVKALLREIHLTITRSLPMSLPMMVCLL